MTITRSFWKNKRVVITGHTGFKGAWLTRYLANLGAYVSGYSLPCEQSHDLFNLANVAEGIETKFSDIRDTTALRVFFEKIKPEIIIHMAAQPVVSRGYAEPATTFEINVMGTVNVLENVRLLDYPTRTLVISSDKCYINNNAGRPFKVGDALGGSDPYSASKAATEMVVSAYNKSYFLDCDEKFLVSGRSGNVIGGGDWTVDRLIPDCVRSVMTDRAILVRNPSYTRPWQHVLDPLTGYLKLIEEIENLNGVDAFNFGPDIKTEMNVHDLVKKFLKMLGKDTHKIDTVKSHFYETKYLNLDCKETNKLINWNPKLSIDEAIKYTADWYLHYLNSSVSPDMRTFTDNQIQNYIER